MSKNLAFDTLNMMDLFGIDKNQLIFHIPHSSIFIPDYKGYNITEQFNTELNLVTDIAVDKIFGIENITKLVTPFSRIFCDVERLDDLHEPMYKHGRGFYYTDYVTGGILRENIDNHKHLVFEKYYSVHHNKLNDLVETKLNQYGTAIIIDCHSFNDEPLIIDDNKETPRPDICIGCDKEHTPLFLLIKIQNYFTELGYNVQINNPYSGTIIPSKYYKQNYNVQGIMIEINKKLYIENNEVNYDNVHKLNKIISDLFS
jgi:N-formylglutamate amidohydrolase